MLSTVEKVDAKERTLTALTELGQRLTFKPDEMKSFRYGYALTAHKSQAVTVEPALVMVDGWHMDKEIEFAAQKFFDGYRVYTMLSGCPDNSYLQTHDGTSWITITGSQSGAMTCNAVNTVTW